jgi:FkbH-like protein
MSLPIREACHVAVAGSFSVEPLKPFLDFWLQQLCSDRELEFAPYGQVLEPLRGMGRVLDRPRRNDVLCADVVLLRPEDLLRSGDDVVSNEPSSLSRARAHVREIAQATELPRQALLVGMVAASPCSRQDLSIGAFDLWAREVIADSVRRGPATHWLDLEAAVELYNVIEIHDSFRDKLVHMPFTDDYLATLATTIARCLRALWEAPRKVIVLDCDNTLWGGACGEDPIEALDPEGPYALLRAFMLKQAHAGRLLCLASRNREVDVMKAFARCADPLSLEHFAAHRISGGRKSDALLSLSEELGLSPDDFIFVDDDPVECAEVRAQLPMVAVVELPAQAAQIPQTLNHFWELDFLEVTDEDRRRGASYALEARRQRERNAAPSLREFVAGLRVHVDVRPLEYDTLRRAAQICARTNQFNLTGARCSEQELLAFAARVDTDVLVIRVEDRLGDYGLVGVLVLRMEPPLAHLALLALSCRVLHRGVEIHIIREVARRAYDSGCNDLAIAFRQYERNGPAREFLDRLCGLATEGSASRWKDTAPAPPEYVLGLDELSSRLVCLESAD